jgi:hypothetical protein
MANQDLLTYAAKVSQVEQSYFAPVSVLPVTNQAISTLYVFLSRVDSWPDDNVPPVPTQDQRYIKSVFANIFVAKQVSSNQISPVIQRIDWQSDVVYQYYQDDIDMFALDQNGSLLNSFYVRNRYDQVFKCLWNNNGALSTVEPFFQPGSYGTNNIYVGSDGYKWKYMYTIDVGSKKTFMDAGWMPVPVGYNTPNPLQTAAGIGDIETINVINGGSGYDPANAVVDIAITTTSGLGSGAAGTPIIQNGVITDVVVTNPGSNYSNYTINVVSAIGSGAVLDSDVSPIGGHGFDPVSELGCSHTMITCEFNGSEGGIIPTDIDYRQVGIVINPTSLSTFPNPANGAIYKVSTDLVVAPGFGVYTSDELVYQGSSLETASYVGTVLSFDPATNVIHIINITGTPTLNATVVGNTSKTARTLLNVSTPDFVPFSGYMTIIENRTGVQRSFDGIEQFKFVLGF